MWPGPVTPELWARHKRFVGFGPEDGELLARHGSLARGYGTKLVDDLHEHLLRCPESRQLLSGRSVAALKRLQEHYFLELTRGDYGADYLARRIRTAREHQELGLPLHFYLNTCSVSLLLLMPYVLEDSQETLVSLLKLLLLDQAIAVECYLSEPG